MKRIGNVNQTAGMTLEQRSNSEFGTRNAGRRRRTSDAKKGDILLFHETAQRRACASEKVECPLFSRAALQTTNSSRYRLAYVFALAALLSVASGCEDGINSTYGRRGGLGADSVNGTAVLASMFEQTGHRVSTTSRLAPKIMNKADVIVWAPDDFTAPSDKVRDWFKAWWLDAPGRTLIYIGRDFDAAPGYWKQVQKSAPPDQLAEFKRRQAAAQNRYLQQRTDMPADEDCNWFTVKGKRKRIRVKTLTGESSWTAGVNAGKSEIELNGRLVPPADAQTVLGSGSDAIVSRQMISGGKLIVVANGSFLLNLPLVNHEHRKLAGSLIAEVGQGRQVFFLESDAGGPPVLDEDPSDVPRNGMEIFGVKPFDSILLHLALLGVIFCAARFPIFGRPREPAPPRLSDFSRHVWALGQLLSRTKDRAYALGRVLQYQQNSRRESSRRRTAPPSVPHKPAPPEAE
jgi:hypothetical protein